MSIFAVLTLMSLFHKALQAHNKARTFAGGERNKRNAKPMEKEYDKNGKKMKYNFFRHVFSYKNIVQKCYIICL